MHPSARLLAWAYQFHREISGPESLRAFSYHPRWRGDRLFALLLLLLGLLLPLRLT